MINSLPSTTGAKTTSNISSDSPIKKSLGKDDFLNLLITQMQAQDPLDPMKSSDFSAQLAQFSALEQMSNVNKNLEDLISYQANMSNNMAINLIDRTVTIPGKNLTISEGQPGTISYELSADAKSVSIEIYNSKEVQVASISQKGESAGLHEFAWNGKDFGGNTLPDGSYTFTVSATDNSDLPVPTRTSEKSKVTEVIFENGKSYVMTENNNKIDLINITSVGSGL